MLDQRDISIEPYHFDENVSGRSFKHIYIYVLDWLLRTATTLTVLGNFTILAEPKIKGFKP